jgi:methylenetetrahydrofolate reductase (NADPH)
VRIAERYASGKPTFSFEFFPPKTEPGFDALFATIRDLAPLGPDFVSVTWGAGGSTRRKTVELVIQIEREAGLTAMAHLSCVGSSRAQLAEALDRLAAGGIANVLALGGDRPAGYAPPPDALAYANELVALIRSRWSFCIGGACYPETHPLAQSPEADLRHLVQKVRAGAEFLITQLFFDNADYFAFVARARAAGIGVPIVPGIMPVLNAANIRRMTAMSGARIPDALARALAEVEHDDERTRAVGVEWATQQCRELLAAGVPGVHFYTLNRSGATRAIFEKLRTG